MHSGNAMTPSSPAFSVSIGIAALVLEGRPLFDDEYAIADHFSCSHASFSNDSAISSSSSASSSSSTTPSSVGSSAKAARFQPSSDTKLHQTPVSHQQDATQHLQRLRQKLHQLRSTPSTSRDCAEQLLAIQSNCAMNTSCDSDDDLEDVSSKSPNKKSIGQKPVTLNSLQVLAASSIQTTPRSFYEHNGLLKTVESYYDKLSTPSTSGCSSSSSAISTPTSSGCTPVVVNFRIAQLKHESKATYSPDKGQHKILGPHCDLFLKKIGLVKGNGPLDPNPEFDEHYCDKSNISVSISCH